MKSQSVYWVIRIYKATVMWWQVLMRTTTLEAPRSPHMHQLAYVWYGLLLEQESGLIPLGHIFKSKWNNKKRSSAWFYTKISSYLKFLVTCYFSIWIVAVVQSLSRVWLLATSWTVALQAPLSFTVSQKLLKFVSIELVMLSNHLILCHRLVLLPSISPSIRVVFQWVGSSHQVAKVFELRL